MSAPRFKWRHAALLLTAVILLTNWRLLCGRGYQKWDAYDMASPYFCLISDFLHAGRLLYWNPWSNGGEPTFAEPQLGVFSPVLLFFGLVAGGSSEAFRIYWISLWLAGGLGMLLLARHLRAPVWGGLVVALGFVFSGFYTGHAEHTTFIYAYSFLPFIVWRFDVALVRHRFMAAAQAGALWGLSALAGYPALTFCTTGLLCGWALARCIFPRATGERGDWKHAFLVLALVGTIGTIILTPAYFSFVYEGRGYSDRSDHLDREIALASNALHPGTLATLSSPALIELKLTDPRFWRYTDDSSANSYTGAGTLLLVTLALVRRRSERWRWFLLAGALFALGCAMSSVLPFRGWLFDLVPPTRYFRHGSMFRGYFLFLLSVLGALGAREIAEDSGKALRKMSLIAPFLAVVAALAFGATLSVAKGAFPDQTLAIFHFAVVWGGLAAAALMIRRVPDQMTRLLPSVLVMLAIFDGVLAYHFSRGTIYLNGPEPPLTSPRQSSIVLGASGFNRTLGPGDGNLNLYSKIPVLRSYVTLKNRFHETTAAAPALRDTSLGEQRVWFSAHPPTVPADDAAFRGFAQRIRQLRAPVIVLNSRAALLSGELSSRASLGGVDQTPAAVPASTHIISYTPDHLVVEAAAPEDGWLMFTERWSRSWRALVNGTAQPILGANFIYRAVPVTKGENRIDFSFHPFGLPALVILSWATLAAVGLLSLLTFRNEKQTAAPL
jgi:hypothetical protein